MLSKTAERSAAKASPSRVVQAQIPGHRVHDLREEDQGHEARLEPGLRRGILKLGSFERLAGQPFAERGDLAGIGGGQQHLREKVHPDRGRSARAVGRAASAVVAGLAMRGAAAFCDVCGSTAVNPCGAARPSQANTSRACVPIASVFMCVMASNRPKESSAASVAFAHESPPRDRLVIVIGTLRRPLGQLHLLLRSVSCAESPRGGARWCSAGPSSCRPTGRCTTGRCACRSSSA